MHIRHRAREAVDVLHCAGGFAGPAAAERLRERIDALCRLGEPIVVLDLTEVERLDDAFLGELLVCRQHVRDAHGLIKLVLSAAQHRAFQGSHLAAMFPIFGAEDEAMASFPPETATYGVP